MFKRISFVLATVLVVNFFAMVAPARAVWTTIPDVVGLNVNVAEERINSDPYLTVGDISHEWSDTVEIWDVISQNPPGGTWTDFATSVDLVVSKGPEFTPVPDLVGMYIFEALFLLMPAGRMEFSPADSYVYSCTVERGYVVSQDPVAGTIVQSGSTVYLYVSGGPNPNDHPPVVSALVITPVLPTTVDSLSGSYTYSDPDGDPESGTEIRWYKNGSLETAYNNQLSIPASATSVGQSWYFTVKPKACAVFGTLETSSTVTIHDVPSTTVVVPDVVGMGESGAGSAITSAGLYVSYSYEYSDTVPEGHVISQNPAGGTSVPEGSDVDLTISRGPRQPGEDTPIPGQSMASCLVAHWKLDDGSGNTAIDSSGNGFDITLHNTTWEDGMFGGAVHFKGVGHGNISNFNCSGNAITVCAWVFHDEFRTYRIERYVTLAGPSVAVIRKEYDGRLHFYLGPEGNFQHLWVDDVLNEGLWHHVAGTWDGLDQRLYIDGVEIAVQRPAGVFSNADSVMLSSEDEPLNGMLDDVRIYNCALSETEIMAVMAGVDSKEPECLMGYWSFDDRAGVIAYDSIGDYHCTIMDGAGGSPAFERGRYGQAIRFYGDGDHVLNEDFDSLINGLDALTVALWVKSDLTNTDKGFIIFEDPAEHDDRGMRYDAFGANGGGVNVIKIGISSDNPNNNGRQQLESSSNVQTDEWQHIAMTWRSGEQLKLYINGILDTPTSNEPGLIGFLADNTKLIIGKGGKDVGDGSWQGLIDDVCIYYCALNENQIESLISAPPSLPSFPSLNSLSNAVDTSLSFTTGGNADWFGQRTTSFYGGDAAQSGDIKSDRESWMQTTVSGKGTVSFFWKVSSERSFDFLEFYIDGSLQDKISGSVDWRQMTYEITGSDLHILEWRYVKDVGTDSGSDCGWVDKVVWMPAP